MSSGATGILFFGIKFDNPEEHEEGFDRCPWQDYYEDGTFDWYRWKDWKNVSDEDSELFEDECFGYLDGVELTRALVFKKYNFSGYPTIPKNITGDLQMPTEEEIQQLKDFCEKYDVPYSEPQWWITAYHG